MLHNRLSQDLLLNTVLHNPLSQDMLNKVLHNQLSQDMLNKVLHNPLRPRMHISTPTTTMATARR